MQELSNIMIDGLVTIKNYNRLVESSAFKEIESFSNDFISKTGSLVASFDNKWIADPFHQWSRQWEYPYIIKNAISLKKGSNIVDLGAGMSFLTYFLEKKLNLKNITAVDYDRTLGKLYDRVNDALGSKIKFQYGDMRDLQDLKSNSADFIYSVSALEHTDAYAEILREIHRILKKGGKFSFTFDISIDGLDDISLTKSEELIQTLKKVFKTKIDVNLQSSIDNNTDELVTSRYISSIDKGLMPWKYPLINVIKPVIKYRKIGSLYKNLTFCCLTVKKS